MPRRLAALLLFLLVVPATAEAQQAPARFDLLIRNGRLLDGSGNPWVKADVGIRDGHVAAVGQLRDATAGTVIDATGLYVAPGFIDTHSHAGESLENEALGAAKQLLAQGITTVFVNPDGGGRVDLAAQRRALQVQGVGVNVAQMVPHGSVRQAVLGMADRAPTSVELARMRELVQAGFDAGPTASRVGPSTRRGATRRPTSWWSWRRWARATVRPTRATSATRATTPSACSRRWRR
jgi:N-acyl-D-aspartate/D-glutamate deacylase